MAVKGVKKFRKAQRAVSHNERLHARYRLLDRDREIARIIYGSGSRVELMEALELKNWLNLMNLTSRN